MSENFETMLTGGHPNSLGRTVEVVELVLADRKKLTDLYQCYFSEDEVVRLRVSSAMKRVTTAHPEWTMDYMDGLQSEIAAIDQASTQWTLAILFDLTARLLSPSQKQRSLDIMKFNLENHNDWFVLNTTMNVLFDWSAEDAELRSWLKPQFERLTKDTRKSVSGRAQKFLAKF
jgi:hypothetical protein